MPVEKSTEPTMSAVLMTPEALAVALMSVPPMVVADTVTEAGRSGARGNRNTARSTVSPP